MSRYKSVHEHQQRISRLLELWDLEVICWPGDVYDPTADIWVRCLINPEHRSFPIRVSSFKKGKISGRPDLNQTKCYECRHDVKLPKKGDRFGLLRIKEIRRTRNGQYNLQVQCACGATVDSPANQVLCGGRRSCGSDSCQKRLRGHADAKEQIGRAYGFLIVSGLSSVKTETGNAIYTGKCNVVQCHRPYDNERTIYDSQLRGIDRKFHCPCGAWRICSKDRNICYSIPYKKQTNNLRYAWDQLVEYASYHVPNFKYVSSRSFAQRVRKHITSSSEISAALIRDSEGSITIAQDVLLELLDRNSKHEPNWKFEKSGDDFVLPGERRQYCIYKITRILDGRPYIGLTSHFGRRLTEHTHRSHNKYLRASIQTYGVENHTFEVMYEFSCFYEAREKEVELIDKLDALRKGFNISRARAAGSQVLLRIEQNRKFMHCLSEQKKKEDISSVLGLPTKDVGYLVAGYNRRCEEQIKARENNKPRQTALGRTMWRRFEFLSDKEKREVDDAISSGSSLSYMQDRFDISLSDLKARRDLHIASNKELYSSHGRRLKVLPDHCMLIIHMYAYGWSLREIEQNLNQIPGFSLSRTCIAEYITRNMDSIPSEDHVNLRIKVNQSFMRLSSSIPSDPRQIAYHDLGYWQQDVIGRFVKSYVGIGHVNDALLQEVGISMDSAFTLRKRLEKYDIGVRDGLNDVCGTEAMCTRVRNTNSEVKRLGRVWVDREIVSFRQLFQSGMAKSRIFETLGLNRHHLMRFWDNLVQEFLGE